MTEDSFHKHFEWLIDETRSAMAVYEAYEEMNRLAVSCNDIQNAMIADHAFWQIQLGSLQVSLFVILGRIFENGKNAHSVSKVIDAAARHLQFFSPESLARRKLAGGLKPEDLD